MIVGMTTVFAILLIVINLGKGLIDYCKKTSDNTKATDNIIGSEGWYYEPDNRRHRIGSKRYDRRKRKGRQDREIVKVFIHIILYHEKRNQI